MVRLLIVLCPCLHTPSISPPRYSSRNTILRLSASGPNADLQHQSNVAKERQDPPSLVNLSFCSVRQAARSSHYPQLTFNTLHTRLSTVYKFRIRSANTMLDSSQALPGSLVYTPASAPSKRLRYKNLRYGCKLCPDKVFSQLAAPLKSRTRESAVEGHVRKQHPAEAKRWRRVAYRWGVRAYYTDRTTADIKDPAELPPVMENDDTEEEDHVDEVHATDGQVTASAYIPADEQPIDPGLQTSPEADRKDSGPHIKTEHGGPALYQYPNQDLKASDSTSVSAVQYSAADTPATGYMTQTYTGLTATNVGALRSPTTGPVDIPSMPYRPHPTNRRQLQPPIEFPPSPYTNTTVSTSMSPQLGHDVQSSFLKAELNPHGQARFTYQPLPQSPTSDFDKAALAGTYGPRIAALAEQLVTYAFATKQEQASLYGQYVQETRKILISENHQLRTKLGTYEERYGVM